MCINENPIDLFGNTIETLEDSVETDLKRRDEATIEDRVYDNGYSEESRKGIGRTLKFLRRHNLLHTFILDEIDTLRRKRNHFAHFKTDDVEMRVDMRTVAAKLYDPHTLMQKDAEFSLRLLHHLYRTQLGKINVSS